jgi:LCP family protein required for cell wall assembly
LKKFFKRLGIFLLSVLVLGVVAFFLFKSFYVPSHLKRDDKDIEAIIVPSTKDKDKKDTGSDDQVREKTEDELWIDHIKGSDRVNVLLFGTDGYRADTLIFFSYSKKENDISLISVPRDTLNEVEGMTGLGQDKINAVYCFPDGMGGSENQKLAVEKVLGVPIHYYIKINYNGLKAIVDTLGGIEINVHRNMYYDDSEAKPELHVHLNKGKQVLSGDQAMGYVRWRKNNDGTGDSDLQRTQRQQNFIIAVVKKSFGFKITKIIDLTFDYVKTDMTKEDVLYFGTDLIGFDFDSINKYLLPGEADYRYFYHNPEETKDLVQKIYGFK